MIFNKLKLFVTRVIICSFAFFLLQKCQPTFNPGTSWTASGKVQSTKGQTQLNWFILISDTSKTPEDIIECHSMNTFQIKTFTFFTSYSTNVRINCFTRELKYRNVRTKLQNCWTCDFSKMLAHIRCGGCILNLYLSEANRGCQLMGFTQWLYTMPNMVT